MNKSTQQTLIAIMPWIGVILLLAGALTYIAVNRFTTVVNVLLGLGALTLLLFAVFRPDDVRVMFSGRHFRYGLNTFLSILFVVIIAGILFYVAYRNNDWRYDTTETGEFTLLSETQDLLEGLEEPIRVVGFYSPQLSFQQAEARGVLDTLTAYTDQISYSFEDPLTDPLAVDRYELTRDGTLVFIRGEAENEVFSKANSTAEQDIYNAIVRVLNPQEKKLYFITGHGEPAYDGTDEAGLGQSQTNLVGSGFTLESLNLFTAGSVPADASAVVIVDPQTIIPAEEVEALRNYLNSGGALFVAQDFPNTQAMLDQLVAGQDTLAPLLAEWGIEVRLDIVIDFMLAQSGQADGATFLGVEFGSSPIIGTELPNYGTVFRFARSMDVTPVPGVTQVELVLTSEDAWGETDIFFERGDPVPDEEDALGPLVIGASAENMTTGGRIVVFSDSDFIRNAYYPLNGNNILVTNAMNWLAGDELSIELAPRETIQRTVTIPQEQLTVLRLISIWLGPVLMLVIGVAVWYSRRQVR